MVDILVTYQNIIKELHNLHIHTNIILLDISNIDCANLNEDKLKEIINDSELIEIKKSCNIPKNSLRSDILNLDIDDSTNNNANIPDTDVIIQNITNMLTNTKSPNILDVDASSDKTNSDESGYEEVPVELPEVPAEIQEESSEPTPVLIPETIHESIVSKSTDFKPKIKQIRLPPGNSSNIIKPLQKWTGPAKVPIVNTLPVQPTIPTTIQQTVPVNNQAGGTNSLGINISIDKINNVLYKNCTTIHQITKYYYENESNKILNGHELILVLVSFKYCEFIEKKVEHIHEIITTKFINAIPEKFKFNFYDMISKDIHNNTLITSINKQANIIKNLIHSLQLQKQSNINENLDSYNITNLIISVSTQNGGASKKNKTYKTVDEKINEKIRRLSEYLKIKNKKHIQRGGGFNKNQQDKIDEIKNTTNPLLASIKPSDAKDITKQLTNYSNIWSIELVDLNLATKDIQDNKFGIAEFKLNIHPDITNVKDKNELNAILDIVNDYANVLNFGKREPKPIMNQLTVSPIGKARPSHITDKLQKYFSTRYEKLEKLKLDNTNNKKLVTNIIDELKDILHIQTGGVNNSDELMDDLFTSKQYRKFIQKISQYFSTYGKNIDQKQLQEFNEDIKVLEELENKLINYNKIFKFYKVINDEYPTNIKKDMTINHIKQVIEDNKHLIDQYGNYNKNTIELVKSIEKSLLLNNTIDEIKNYPDVKQVVDELLQQKGGNYSLEKKYGVSNDQEYFTTDTFKKILASKEYNS